MTDDQHTTMQREQTERDTDHAQEETRDGEASALARHRDPSLSKQPPEKDTVQPDRTGVQWVRPTDLMASGSARMAGRGIDFEAELARRSRGVPGQLYRGTRTGVRAGTRFVSERARRLPPVTAFGRGAAERFSWVSRSGIGLG